MGTAEIYRAVLALDEITDALVVDIAKGDDAWMPLFVVLRDGAELDDDLEKAIAKRVREDCSPRHVPSEVFEVKEVPRTLSGKVLEVPVKKILTGTPADKAASRDSLQNPESLDYFVELAAERGLTLVNRHRGVACPGSDPQRRENRDVLGHPRPHHRGGGRRKPARRVDVAGVQRNVNIGLLDADEGGGVGPGDWVLIHVGFALSQVDEEEAEATLKLLQGMGEEYEQELEELKAA